MNFKRTVISLFAGLISLASLSISFSLAWFAASTRLYVDTLEVEMRGERNLKISTSDIKDSFKEKLEFHELDESGLFMPVSSMFESKWIDEYQPVPTFYEYTAPFVPESGIPYGPKEMNEGYYQQDIYLLCDDDAYISLDIDKTFFKPNEEANLIAARRMTKESSEEDEEETIYGNLNKLVNALRFSIFDVEEKNYFIVDPTKSGTTLLGGALDNDRDQYFDVYTSPTQERKEAIYGEVYNRENAVYADVGEEDIDIDEGTAYTCFNAKHKAHAERFLLEESLSNGLVIKEEPSLDFEDISSPRPDENKLVIPVKHDVPKRLIFSIYLEGWDLDCVNVTMGGNFLSQIQFKILREM